MNEEKNDYKVADRHEAINEEEKFKGEKKLNEIKEGLKEEVRRVGMNRIKNFLKHSDKELCLLIEEMWQELDKIDRIGGNR